MKSKEWSLEKKKFIRGLALLLTQNGDIDMVKEFKELKAVSPVSGNLSVNEAEKVLTSYFS